MGAATRETHLECNRRYFRRLRERALLALGYTLTPPSCPKCGEPTDQLEFAHQQPTVVGGTGRGQHRRWRDVIRHPERYALRYKSCNAKEPKFHYVDESPIPD